MKKLLVLISKFILACLGPGLLLYLINLFEKYHSLGMKSKDSMNVVPLENHGAVQYVSEDQYRNFHFYLILGVVVTAIFLATIAITKFKERRRNRSS